jgi:hypothetical protein
MGNRQRGKSQPQATTLKRLEDEGIFSIEKSDDPNSFWFVDECDRNFWLKLTRDEMRQLAAEILQIADSKPQTTECLVPNDSTGCSMPDDVCADCGYRCIVTINDLETDWTNLMTQSGIREPPKLQTATVTEAGAADFFAYARKRQTILIKRLQGEPRPWTDDPALGHYRFCNVFREDDKTTKWFADNVRNQLADKPEALLATVFFRWFNRIESAEVLFQQPGLDGKTPWETFLETGGTDHARMALKLIYPKGPYITGSYVISSPHGMDKLDGVLLMCQEFRNNSKWRTTADRMLIEPGSWSLQRTTEWLAGSRGMGMFLAYEVVCDLYHTDLLRQAPDIMTWANIGPGARRGLNRIAGRFNRLLGKGVDRRAMWGSRITDDRAVSEMKYLLHLSRSNDFWPQGDAVNWPAWDMRTVEHTLCEFDKFVRTNTGEGSPRQLLR